jgi:PII-like signaling protein
MLKKGPAKKVTVYLNLSTRRHLQPLWQAIFDYLHHKGIAGANVWVPHTGFGSHERVRRSDSAEIPEPSVRLEFIDTAERVNDVLPTLYEMVTDGVIEVQDTTVVKAVRQDQAPKVGRTHKRITSSAKMMRVFFGEADKWQDEPLYDAIVKQLRMMDIAGATVYRGILGYGVKGHTHKAGLLRLSSDLPIMISVVDIEEKILQAAEAIERMLGDALIVISDVDMIRLVHSADLEESGDATTHATS